MAMNVSCITQMGASSGSINNMELCCLVKGVSRCHKCSNLLCQNHRFLHCDGTYYYHKECLEEIASAKLKI